MLHYLQATQEGDGHWPQNMWLDGRPYWNGVQMDEAALPILLVDLAYVGASRSAVDCADMNVPISGRTLLLLDRQEYTGLLITLYLGSLVVL